MLNLILLLKNSYGAACSGFCTTGTKFNLCKRVLHAYHASSQKLRQLFHIILIIPGAENSLYHRHTYFEHNHLVTKQLAVAYKTQKSWEWEVLFLVYNWFLLKITQVLDEILFISTLAGPAHLLQFVISLVSTEGELTPHLPSSALVLARRLLAVPWLWQGPPWMGQGPVALSCTSLWWECQQTQLRGGEVSAEQAQRALSCPFHAGRMPNKSITLKLETSRERFRKEWFFSIRNYLSTRPWAKPAVAPSCQWEICTSVL